jgi:hypothetical protein
MKRFLTIPLTYTVKPEYRDRQTHYQKGENAI